MQGPKHTEKPEQKRKRLRTFNDAKTLLEVDVGNQNLPVALVVRIAVQVANVNQQGFQSLVDTECGNGE